MTRFVKTYNVYEGDSGVLELTDTKGNIEIYQPDCDLDKTQRLLYSFYEIKTSTGNIVKNSYVINERDWFPTSIGQLYWNYFYQIVKYRDLIDKYKLGKIKFTSLGGGNFEKVIDCIDCSHNNSLRVWLKKLYHRIIIIRNVILVKKKSDVIFFSYLIDDFRTKEIIESISEKYSVLHVAWVEKKKILRNIFNSNVYFYTSFNSCNMFNIAAIGCDDYVYNSALDYVNKTVSNHVQLYKDNIIIFNRLSAKVFAGIDDVSYVYPLLYAAKDCGIKSVGIQHGAYAKRHEAWIMKDINKHDWYDNVIVWGKYWKTIILNNSKLYSDNFHIVASNKHAYDYTHCTKKMTDNRSILIPYEFLADTIEIGNYIRMFIDHGVTVYFKARPDRIFGDQIHSYFLGSYESKIKVIADITPLSMAKIDIVVGTSTSLLYDLLPYNKPVWLLETPLRIYHDMLDYGFAKSFTKDDFVNLETKFDNSLLEDNKVDPKLLFGDQSISDVIKHNYL